MAARSRAWAWGAAFYGMVADIGLTALLLLVPQVRDAIPASALQILASALIVFPMALLFPLILVIALHKGQRVLYMGFAQADNGQLLIALAFLASAFRHSLAPLALPGVRPLTVSLAFPIILLLMMLVLNRFQRNARPSGLVS